MSVDVAALQAAQAQGLTVGVVPKAGSPPALRLEIDDFLLDTDLANLYFLAMESFMSDKESVKAFSYYEISGIHGQPHRAWDGFEQALFLRAVAIAPDLNATAVLDRFRIPYFDPFLPRQLASDGSYVYGVPIIFTLPNIMVKRTAAGKWESMPNPLYSFKFSQAARKEIDFSSYFGNLPAPAQGTIRGLDVSRDGPNHTYVVRALDNVYNPENGVGTGGPLSLWHVMMDANQNWVRMSNHFSRGSFGRITGNQNSLEGFHDNIHVQLAQGEDDDNAPAGHMSVPDYAGFDPSFWLHHCNVDRLLAIWQGIHSKDPESTQWWTSLVAPQGTFVEPSNENETPLTPLVPFRKAKSATGAVTWWLSRDVRNHRALGYDYPQTAQAAKAPDYVASLRAWANAELGWVTPAPGRKQPADEAARTRLKASFVQSVPFFPAKVLVDGRDPLAAGDAFIGSKAVVTTASVAVASTPRAVVAAAAKEVTTIEQKAPNTIVASTVSATAVAAAPVNVKSSGPAVQAVAAAATAAVKSEVTAAVGKAEVKSLAANGSHAAAAPAAIAGEVKSEQAVAAAAKPTFAAIRQQVLECALPKANPSFSDRYGHLGKIVSDERMTQWNVTFSVDKFCLDGSFMIYFFLGDFNPDPKEWLVDPHLAGHSGIFASTRERISSGACGNCKAQEEAGMKYADTVSLTPALLHFYQTAEEVYGLKVTSMAPESVVPFLTRNMHWRILKCRGGHVPREEMPSLKVSVYSERVHLPCHLTDLPSFDEPVLHYEVTAGRPSGVGGDGDW